jgi:hypothetical protein
MLRDLLHHVSAVRGISPVSGGANDTASTSEIIDMAGYTGCLWLIPLGNVADADATFTVLVEHGNDSGLSDAAAAPDTNMISSTAGTAPEAAASFIFSSDNTVEVLDYIVSTFRYVRLTITPANNTGAWLHGAVALKYGARHNPAGVTQAP